MAESTLTLIHPDRIAEAAKLKQQYSGFIVLDPKGIHCAGRHYAQGTSLAEVEGLGAGTLRTFAYFKQIGLAGGSLAPVSITEREAHHAIVTKKKGYRVSLAEALVEAERLQTVVAAELAQIQRGEFNADVTPELASASIATKQGWLAVNAAKISEYKGKLAEVDGEIRNLSAAIGDAFAKEARRERSDAETGVMTALAPYFSSLFLVSPAFEKLRPQLLTNTLGFLRAEKLEQWAITLSGPNSVGIDIDRTVGNTLRALESEMETNA